MKLKKKGKQKQITPNTYVVMVVYYVTVQGNTSEMTPCITHP